MAGRHRGAGAIGGMREPDRMGPAFSVGRVIAVLAFVVLFLVGIALVVDALRGSPPEATPVPDEEFTLSVHEALAVDPEIADAPIALPDRDLGEFVNTEPVSVPTLPPANHLYIPSLYVSAPIVAQGVTADNEMAIPDNLHQVGLLETTSALADEQGSTIIAGHVTSGGDHAALYFLGRIQAGARVITTDADGEPIEWVVTGVRNYHKQALPDELFDTEGARVLTLVTCGGEIIQTPEGRWTYEDNIVVSAEPVP